MKFFNKIDFRNILIDIVIALLAAQLIDISGLVEKSLPWMIYFLIIIQSFAFFLLYSDTSIDDESTEKTESNFLLNLQNKFAQILNGYSMFAWVFGSLWLILPVLYLQGKTGNSYAWTMRFGFFVGLVNGIILLVRFFGNADEAEKENLKNWKKEKYQKSLTERIVVSTYDFFLYGNIGTPRIRFWLAYFVSFGFFIYTETLFIIITEQKIVALPIILMALLVSYFPMRMLLVLRPPFSFWEMISALSAFGYFIYQLFD